MDNFARRIVVTLIIINCQFSIINFSCSAQRFDYKDRNEGDTVTVNKKIYTIHKCKKDETIYTIAAKYHVSVNDLDNANKDVINNLKKNTILLIPVLQKKEEVKKEEPKAIPYKDFTYKIALLIPFNEGRNYSFDSTLAGGYALNAELEKETTSSLEFYEGVLMAVDSLKHKGLKVYLSVIDAYDSASVNAAKKKAEVKGADVLLINLNQNLAGLLSNYSANGKPVIISCAANTSASLKNDSSAFFTSPSSLLQCRQMGEYFARMNAMKNSVISGIHLSADRFIIIKTAFSKEVERANAFNNALEKASDKPADLVILDTTMKSINTLDELMLKGKNNVVFLPTTDEAYVSDVISLLKKHTAEFDITLAGLPTWQYFQSVNPEDLKLLRTMIFSSVYISYDAAPVVAFRKTFRDKYFTEPSENAFTGYDAAIFLGEQLLNHGITMNDNTIDKNYKGLSTNFHFAKDPGASGFENDYISILKFEDYSLKKVNK